MHKKLMMACMAITAFAAFVVAPAASGAVLTESGSAVAVGSSITGTAGETKFTAGGETVTCSKADMSGTVTANANGTVAAEIAAGNPIFLGTAGSDCTSSGLGPVKWTVNSKLCFHVAKGTDQGTVTGCAGAAVTFTLSITNIGIECHYEKSSIVVEITTSPADAQVRVIPGQKVPRESNFLCPKEGELDMEFTLTTTDETTLTFS